MTQLFMSFSHRASSPLAWRMAPRQAVTLAADRSPRTLWVHEGRVWLTRQAEDGPPEDIWLSAGQSQRLPAGTEWVAEAWPQACVSLVQAPPAVAKREAACSCVRPWRRLRGSPPPPQ